MKSWSHYIKTAAAWPPVARVFSHGASCLMYHRVVDDDSYSVEFCPNKGLSVSRTQFETQMRFLARHCEPLTISDAVDRLRASHLSNRAVTVTFDDGYEDNLTIALPILRRYQIPATIYVTTDGPDRKPFLWWYELESLIGFRSRGSVDLQGRQFSWSNPLQQQQCFIDLNAILKVTHPTQQRNLLDCLHAQLGPVENLPSVKMLTWNQVRELAADPLITIGCHTASHHPMTSLSTEELRCDLEVAKTTLETQLGHAVEHFAYPYGKQPEATGREFSAVRDTKFVSAVTTRPGHWLPAHSAHLFALPRLTVTWFDTAEEFKLKLFGVRATLSNRGWHAVTD